MFSSHFHEPTMILEAMALYDHMVLFFFFLSFFIFLFLLYYYYYYLIFFFHNDISTLKRVSVFFELADGCASSANCQWS